MQSPDPFFKTPTEITQGVFPINPSDVREKDAAMRAAAICAAAYEVRTVMYARYKELTGEDPQFLPLQEQTMLLLAAFCDRQRAMTDYNSPELAASLSRLRQLVPLVEAKYYDHLVTPGAVSATSGEVRSMLRLLRELHQGKPEDQYRAALERLAYGAKISLPDGVDTGTMAETLEKSLQAMEQANAIWEELPEGTESRVYLSPGNNTVYKAMPFRAVLIGINPILGDDPVDANRDAQTYLADDHGRMPLFDRYRLMASLPGFCRTEMVAFTTSGMAILKQPFLGSQEPGPLQIEAWAEQYGHEQLPEQPAAGGNELYNEDLCRRPVVMNGTTPGQYVIGVDINARNMRNWNGQAVPFDPVLRELDPMEIASHRQISQAVSRLPAPARTASRGVDLDM